MKKIISVSLAVLCLVVLIFNIEVNQQKEAWALQFGTTTTTASSTVLGLKYIPFGVHNYAVDVEEVASPLNFFVRVIDTNTTNTISTLNLNSSLNRPTLGTSYSFDNISCDVTGSGLCALSFFVSTTVTRVVVFDAVNNVASTLSTGFNWTSGQPLAVAFSHGNIQSTVFMGFLDVGGTNHLKILSLVMNNSQSVQDVHNRLVAGGTFDTLQVGFSPSNGVLGSIPVGANSGNYVAWMSSAGSFDLYKASSNTNVCIVSLGAGTSGDIDFVNLNTASNYWLASAKTTNNIKQVDFACNILTTITASANVNGITHSPSRNEFYYQSGSAIFVGNLTSLSSTTITSFNVGANNGQAYGNMITNDQATVSGTTALFVGTGLSTSKVSWIYWNTIGSGGGGTTPPQNTCGASNPSNCVGQTDCSLPANVNLAMCFINQNPKFNNGFAGTGGMLNSSVTTLSCSIGLVKCIFDSNGNGTPINGNVQTNGVGYLIAIIGLAILISIFWVASDHDLRNIPTFVWFIAVLGLLGALVALQWLDPTFFIVAIIAVVGLAAAKARGLFDSF